MPIEEGSLILGDGRALAWQAWGDLDARLILRIQGAAGSRLAPPSISLWTRFGLRGLAADRPGFGRSTRLPGRGVRVVADDLARLLDTLGIESVPVLAYSAGGPHGLALAACHPDRVESLTVVSGACPLLAEERKRVVHANAVMADLVDAGWDAVHNCLMGLRRSMLDHGTLAVLGDTDPADMRILEGRDGHKGDRQYRAEALRQGAEGWADEAMALIKPWDFELSALSAPVQWWHGANDRVVPLSAAQRLADTLLNCVLTVLEDRAHYLPASTVLSEFAER